MSLRDDTNRLHDFEGLLRLALPTEGGRNSPVVAGYRPQFKIHDNYQTTGLIEFVGKSSLSPGEASDVRVWLITPAVYPRCLWERRLVDVLEGNRLIGQLDVSAVINQVLLVDEKDYSPVWIHQE